MAPKKKTKKKKKSKKDLCWSCEREPINLFYGTLCEYCANSGEPDFGAY